MASSLSTSPSPEPPGRWLGPFWLLVFLASRLLAACPTPPPSPPSLLEEVSAALVQSRCAPPEARLVALEEDLRGAARHHPEANPTHLEFLEESLFLATVLDLDDPDLARKSLDRCLETLLATPADLGAQGWTSLGIRLRLVEDLGQLATPGSQTEADLLASGLIYLVMDGDRLPHPLPQALLEEVLDLTENGGLAPDCRVGVLRTLISRLRSQLHPRSRWYLQTVRALVEKAEQPEDRLSIFYAASLAASPESELEGRIEERLRYAWSKIRSAKDSSDEASALAILERVFEMGSLIPW